MAEHASLLDLPQFRKDLSQIGERAALNVLGQNGVVSTKWRYCAERIIRNLTAITAELEVGDHHDTQKSGMFFVARAWENLATLGEDEMVHSSTALLNAALAYEWAGYQANAACLARLAASESRWTTDPSFDGLVSAFLQRLFVRVKSLESRLTELPSPELLRTDAEVDRRAALAVAAIALSAMSSYFLTGQSEHIESAKRSFDLACAGLAQSGDAAAYNTVVGLKKIVPVMVQRSTWSNLEALSPLPRWHRYLKVLARGLGDNILASRSISDLWPSQVTAVESGLLTSEESHVIRMPTSAGKTRVAELAIVYSLIAKPGLKCVYVAPYRALANEIEQSFANLFHDLGYGVSTVPGGYDQDEMGENLVECSDVLVLTPEKLDLLLRLQPESLEKVALIVFDESHIVADRQRGPKFELLVSRLRRKIPEARFLMMSAVVPDATLKDFAKWLGGSSGQIISTKWRPSGLKLGLLDWNGKSGTLKFSDDDASEGGIKSISNLIKQAEYPHVAEDTRRMRRPKFPNGTSKGEVAAEVAYRFAPLGSVLVFAMQTNWAESIARALLRRIEFAELTVEIVPDEFRMRTKGRAVSVAAEWLGEEHLVTKLLCRGIAFHHGRLPSAVRDALEADFREQRLGALVATSTLAQGVNLPVRTVVIHSCRSREADGSPRVLSAREYWNIAGRAGRAGSETEGTVVHIATTSYDVEDFNKYARQRNEVERVESALYRMLRDLVAERISSEQAARQLDADLLALLVEEARDELYDQVLVETLPASLFQIQAVEKDTEVKPLIEVMTSTARRISETVADMETLRLFAATGLSSRSCKAIASHVEANSAEVEQFLASEVGYLENSLDLVLEGLAGVSEMEPISAVSIDARELLSVWISGEAVKKICDAFIVEDPQDVTEFIEDAFSYRLPWGVSSYIRLASALTGAQAESRLAANLAGMVKYGVPSPEAAWAMSAGVVSRNAAMAVADDYYQTAGPGSVAAFRRWLGQLDPDMAAERLGFTGTDLESTARTILKLQPNDYLTKLDCGGELLPLQASCYLLRCAIRSGLFFRVARGDRLKVQRDTDSQLNRNAVLILADGEPLGYLQADAARALALELDAGLEVLAEAIDIKFKSVELIVEIRVASDAC